MDLPRNPAAASTVRWRSLLRPGADPDDPAGRPARACADAGAAAGPTGVGSSSRITRPLVRSASASAGTPASRDGIAAKGDVEGDHRSAPHGSAPRPGRRSRRAAAGRAVRRHRGLECRPLRGTTSQRLRPGGRIGRAASAGAPACRDRSGRRPPPWAPGAAHAARNSHCRPRPPRGRNPICGSDKQQCRARRPVPQSQATRRPPTQRHPRSGCSRASPSVAQQMARIARALLTRRRRHRTIRSLLPHGRAAVVPTHECDRPLDQCEGRYRHSAR